MPIVRGADEAQREVEVGVPALEVPRMRCERDPRERRGRQGPREVRVLAAVEGRPGRHAGRRAHLQAEDRRVLGAVADAGRRRRGAPRRLRRRHMNLNLPRIR